MEFTAKRESHLPTDKALAEQLQITEREISQRKSLLGLTDSEVKLLVNSKAFVAERLEAIVDEFYDQQLSVSEIAALIGDAETLERLRASMHRYILELFDGYYDAEYVNKRLRIGKVHNRIGVSPKLYISAITLLEEILERQFLEDPDLPPAHPSFEARRRALHKLLMFDVQLVFDTYISSLVAEVNSAKGELENCAESLEEVIAQRTRQLHEMSTTDDLTGLLNQRALHENLRREVSAAERAQAPLSLIYFDLNAFKALNDTMGRREGDKVLENVGKAIRDCIRDMDIPCRYGGDEFCIIMPRAEAAVAQGVWGRIIEKFNGLPNCGVTFSTGIVQAGPGKIPAPDDIIKAADTLMYEAKADSRHNPGHKVQVSGPAAPTVVDLSGHSQAG